MTSLRGRRRRGGKGKKKQRTKRVSVREGDACKDAILFSSFCPLTKYAKLIQLWNVWLSKLSNQNHAAFFAVKSVDADGFSYFLFLVQSALLGWFGG